MVDATGRKSSMSAYALGKLIGRNPGWVVGGLVAFATYLALPSLQSGPPAATGNGIITPDAKKDLDAFYARRAEEDKAKLEVERQHCATTALDAARAEAKAGKMIASRATLQPCRGHLTGESEEFAAKVFAAAAVEDERELKRARAADKARKKRDGVRLGMSQQDVIDSSWGKPRKINRSIYTFGVHEQWVYDGGYLYFKDGVLDSIQN